MTADDALAGNDNNNATWQQIASPPVGANGGVSLVGAVHTQQPAIYAWQSIDPAVVITPVDMPGDGRFLIAKKITSLGGGNHHYEFAVQNLNSDRSGRGFTVTFPAGTVITNAGFRSIPYHSGEPYASTPWTITTSGNSINWATQLFIANPNANALRWGTMYSFWFDATAAAETTKTIELFKPENPCSLVFSSPLGAGSLKMVNTDCPAGVGKDYFVADHAHPGRLSERVALRGRHSVPELLQYEILAGLSLHGTARRERRVQLRSDHRSPVGDADLRRDLAHQPGARLRDFPPRESHLHRPVVAGLDRRPAGGACAARRAPVSRSRQHEHLDVGDEEEPVGRDVRRERQLLELEGEAGEARRDRDRQLEVAARGDLREGIRRTEDADAVEERNVERVERQEIDDAERRDELREADRRGSRTPRREGRDRRRPPDRRRRSVTTFAATLGDQASLRAMSRDLPDAPEQLARRAVPGPADRCTTTRPGRSRTRCSGGR